jgi:hypothetical protein
MTRSALVVSARPRKRRRPAPAEYRKVPGAYRPRCDLLPSRIFALAEMSDRAQQRAFPGSCSASVAACVRDCQHTCQPDSVTSSCCCSTRDHLDDVRESDSIMDIATMLSIVAQTLRLLATQFRFSPTFLRAVLAGRTTNPILWLIRRVDSPP